MNFSNIVHKEVRSRRSLGKFEEPESFVSNKDSIIISSGIADIAFYYDHRVNIIECDIGLSKYRDKLGRQYSTVRIVDFYEVSSEFSFPLNDSPSEQVRIHLDILEKYCTKLVNGDLQEFDRLHKFSSQRNHEYTQEMSWPIESDGLPADKKNRPTLLISISIAIVIVIVIAAIALYDLIIPLMQS